MKDIIQNLNKAFDHRVRLGIMSALAVNEAVEFTTLRDLLGVTDGNLASHLKALEKEQFIKVKKTFVDRKPNTTYAVTGNGKKAFNAHIDTLEKLIHKK